VKRKFIDYYMQIAELTSQLSYAKRLQVGAVIVKGNQILSSGFNGMPSGWENVCETKEYMTDVGGRSATEEIETQWPYQEFSTADGATIRRYRLVSKPETMHAERNCLDKVAASNESTAGATLLTTHAPCLECAKSIYNTGITTVYYKHEYKTDAGIQFLKKTGVNVHKYNDPELPKIL
jgi:dCMP deaminase